MVINKKPIHKKQKLIMVDFAMKDRRSVKAMLLGLDDGRGARYTKFIEEESLREPILTLEELMQIYSIWAKAEYYREKEKIEKNVHLSWIRSIGPFKKIKF